MDTIHHLTTMDTSTAFQRRQKNRHQFVHVRRGKMEGSREAEGERSAVLDHGADGGIRISGYRTFMFTGGPPAFTKSSVRATSLVTVMIRLLMQEPWSLMGTMTAFRLLR
ncbi:MAG: hypothetical protein CMN05_11985 [Roseibacillus sp.]|jgi:hypothetical protein|nr:hypothetical protein [Roseibacillus sp.]